MADSEDEEWTGRVNPLVYAQRLLHLGEHGDWKGFAQWIENDGKRFNGVHVCPSTKLRDDSVNNRFLASTEILAELGQIRPGVRASSRGRRSPVEPLSPATVAPPSPPSPGAKIDAALASPEAPPPAPVSSPDEPDDEPEDPMLALEYTGP